MVSYINLLALFLLLAVILAFKWRDGLKKSIALRISKVKCYSGLGGEVLKKAGGIPVTLTGGGYLLLCNQALLMLLSGLAHIMTLPLLIQTADYYYYSGWHGLQPC